MFDSIRKHQRIFLGLLLLLVLPALVLFGVSGYERTNQEPVVARVGDAKVTQQEFEQSLQRQLEQFRQYAGPQADISAFDTPELRKNLLESLIARKASERLAEERRIFVGDQQVREQLMAIPQLQGPDGKFAMAEYKARLAQIGQTPAMFEAQMKKDIAAQMLAESLGLSGFGPQVTRDRLTALTEEVRTAKPLRISLSEFTDKVKLTEEQIKAFYEKNSNNFRVPETAKIEYVVLSADAIATTVQLNPDDVKTFYEQNKQRYGQSEQRRASHIFFDSPKSKSAGDRDKAKAAAEAVLAELKTAKPETFAELAKTKSQDSGSASKGGDLGFFTKEGMTPEVAKAVYEMTSVGATSGVVESEDGFHIIRLTEIRKDEPKPFESVKAEIENDLKKQQATRRFAEASQQFTDTVFEQADTFKSVVEKFKIPLQTAQGLSRAGLAPAGGAAPAPALANQKFLKAIFSEESIREKKNITAVELAPGQLASARIIEYTPASTRPLSEVKSDVEKLAKQEEAKKLAVTAGQAKLKALQAGEAPQGFGDGVLTVSRLNPGSLTRPTVEAIFRANAIKLPAYAGVEEEGGFTIYQVASIKAGDGPEVAQRKQQLEARVDAAFTQQEFVAFTESLKQRSNVRREDKELYKGLEGKPIELPKN